MVFDKNNVIIIFDCRYNFGKAKRMPGLTAILAKSPERSQKVWKKRLRIVTSEKKTAWKN